MVDIGIKNKELDSQNHLSTKKEEYSMSRSDIRRFVTGKWQDKDSSAGSKILVSCGILLLLFIPYFHSNSILENNAVFAQSNPTSNPLTDRSPSFLEAYWTDNSRSTSSSSASSSDNNPIKK